VIVLDTSLLSHAYRRQPGGGTQPPAVREFARLLDEDAPLVVPGIVLQELLSGVKGATAFRALDDILSGFPLLLATRHTHALAAQLRSRCRAKGVAAGSVDCLIAAHAVEADAALFTLDRDFALMAKHTDLQLHKAMD
jgi:predicted nucleic acid-binding protein